MKLYSATLTFLLLLTLLFTGCKKWIIDERNKYIGNYTFTWTELYWDGSNWIYATHQTEGKIFYRPLSHFKKYLTIDIGDGVSFEPAIDKHGNLNEDCSKYLTGTISKSEISCRAASKGNCDDSKGPVTSYTITGTKK